MEFENELLEKALQIDKYNCEVWKRNRQPLVATFELNPTCNLKCIHCYLGKHRIENNILSFEEIKQVLDQLAEAGVLHLALTGGECTIRKDICDIYEYAKKKGFLVTLFTNGIQIPNQLFELFEKYPPFFVDISLYGASNDTYEMVTGKRVFDKVIGTLSELKKRNIVFGIKTPVIQHNRDDISAMREIAKEYDVSYRTGYVILPTIDNEEYPSRLMIPVKQMVELETSDEIMTEIGFKDADIINQWGERFDAGEFVPIFICNPGINDVIIDFKGNICPCAGFRHIGKNIFESSFKEIWKSFEYLKKIPATENNKCMRCQSRYFCRVCPAEQQVKTGDYESVSKEVCQFANVKKMIYKDKMSLEEILQSIE